MYVATDHVIKLIVNTDCGTGIFKIVDERNGRLNAVLDFFRQRYFSLFENFFRDEIEKTVDEDQGIISHSPEAREPFGMLHGYVENIAMEDPCFFVIRQVKYDLVNDAQ